MNISCPRLMIAGMSGDSGKTMITVGLARALTGQGLTVATFKKGPDYIDAAWLGSASGRACRNLDTFLAEPEAVKRSFMRNAHRTGVNLVEGNRGFHDGMDVEGSHSSAALSKLIECPVVLTLDVTKTTRSAAAFVIGSRMLDPGVNIRGVIINRVAGERHERVVRRSIEKHCGVPVFGSIPKLPPESRIPSRHLGLITPGEEGRIRELIDSLGRLAEKQLDLGGLLEVAQNAAEPEGETGAVPFTADGPKVKKARICFLNDSAFSFYYPENLEALEEAGAELVPVSALDAQELPGCEALYVGGGFPETHAADLADNRNFRESLFNAAQSGLPVYAECGGLIYMAESLSWKGKEYPMAGVFPVRMRMEEKPQGHGYTRYLVDEENPFFEKGVELKGHEFHYSRIEKGEVKSVFDVKRGTGCGKGRDGLLRWRVLGTYLHVHALGCPVWADGIVKAAEKFGKENTTWD